MLASVAAFSSWRAALQGVDRAVCGSWRRKRVFIRAETVRRTLNGTRPLQAAGSSLRNGALCPALSSHCSLQRRLCSSEHGQEEKHRSSCNSNTGKGRAPPTGPGGDPAASDIRRLSELYENPWTIPNLLSMTRIGLSPVLGYLIVKEDFNVALGLFALAGFTDLLDGYIARNWANQKSVLGSALDPLADKILISILYVCLTYTGLIPVPLTAMIVLRDVVLIAAVFYVRYKTLPPPMNTGVQLILVAASLAAPVFNYVDSVYLQALWCITAFTTAASAYSYYHYGRETVNILNK
ncbi:cardiolipin synthase (CMP-forming) isoform X2 [Ambystoma mexicanum]|uniref:cardiolipin synthase (CMP-forming) isoform X2 n=1 Tax=Ambystoma mexicanum TaxID=8296 RepID=UPI0037E85A07